MKTIYNAAGEAKELDACDAREHIASGRWFAEAPVTDSPATPLEASAPTPDVLTDTPAADAPKRGRK